MQITPLKPGFAAEITQFQARAANEADIRTIQETMIVHPVLVLRDQALSEDDQAGFAQKFGPLDTNEMSSRSYNEGKREDLLQVSNVTDDLQGLSATDRRRLLDLGNKLWHTDSSFKAIPGHLSMLYGIHVAERGGETQFADMRAAYDALPGEWKDMVADLIAAHSPIHSRVMLGFDDWNPDHAVLHKGVAHDVVRTLPESGRKTLYLSSHASHIVGMAVPPGRMLLHELTELATTADNVYTHQWRQHDFVIWDNRCTMHRLRRYRADREKRMLRRVTTADTAFPSRDVEGIVVPEWIANAAA